MTCKNDTYKRLTMALRYRAMWRKAEPIIVAGKELRGFRKLNGVVLGEP